MGRYFNLLTVYNQKTNVGSRFRKQVEQSSPVGTQVHLACGDASGDLGNIDLVVKVSGQEDIVESGAPGPRKNDSYDILKLQNGNRLILFDTTRFRTFLEKDGWGRF